MEMPKLARWSPAQHALVRLRQIEAKGMFAGVNVLLLVLVFYTSHRFPHKYVRVQGECSSNWVHLGHSKSEEDVICCNDHATGNQPAPCYRGMALSPVLSSLQGAWLLPLVALVINYVCMMLGPNTTMPRVRVILRRAMLYLAVMGFRTLVLYAGFEMFERGILAKILGKANQSCWYRDLRRDHRCAVPFDHSDHIVLLVSHFLAISLFEWFAVNVEIPGSPFKSFKKLVLQLCLSLVGGTAVYMIFYTASYFHSPMENLVGLLLAQGAVMLPLALLTQDYFSASTVMRLRNFVLPPSDVKTQ